MNRRKTGRWLLRGLLLLCIVVALRACATRPDTVAPAAGSVSSPAELTDFRLADPYALPGMWFKVQLHMHTSYSFDGRWSVQEALAAYSQAGYDFVAVTDHDQITTTPNAPPNLVMIAAEENTVAYPFWPLGQHVVFLFANEHIKTGTAVTKFAAAIKQGALISIPHPNWEGNLGTGRWQLSHLLAAPNYTLFEVYNPHSDTALDVALWQELLMRRGSAAPVWAVAVDDAHDKDLFNSGWTMVKAEAKTAVELKLALQRGSIYATNGPLVEFMVDQGVIRAILQQPADIAFIDFAGNTVYEVINGLSARYRPTGKAGFIRVEITDGAGKKAWSQPFWLEAEPAAEL